MGRLSVVMLLSLSVLAGCSRGPTPEQRVKDLFQLMKIADQKGWDVVQEEIYAMLSTASQERIAARCAEVAEGLGRDVPASHCLVFGGFVGGRDLVEVEAVNVRETRARLLLRTTGGESVMDFVKEDGDWRLDLDSSLELAKAGYNVGG
ncbi:MAG: hypothetical protein ABIK09_03810 [Pseudomonadota bacterium]